MMTNKERMRKYLKAHAVCEICNEHIATEVHHKVPVSIGGSDSDDNYIALCEGCHLKKHSNCIYSRSRLSQFGIYKRLYDFNDNNNAKLISVIDLYHILQKINESITVVDMLDIIDNLPSYGIVNEEILNSNYVNISNWLQHI